MNTVSLIQQVIKGLLEQAENLIEPPIMTQGGSLLCYSGWAQHWLIYFFHAIASSVE
jgi:hypothetical protein